MVDSSICHGLTRFAMPQTIYLKPELQSAKHLVSLDAYNFFHCCNNHWSIFRIIKFKYFQLLITSMLQKLIYFMQSWSYFKLHGTVTSFMKFNEMFRYSLLHKHIICTTLFFHRAFPAANWSWLPSSCTYYPAFITTLWNGSIIIINSSFQPLVSHNNTCIISMHSCNASQHLHPYLCMHIYWYFSYASIQCITTRFMKSFNAYPLNATLHWFRNAMNSNIPCIS